MKDHSIILQDLGFTQSEALVYLALLKIGESSTGPIIKNSGISSGKAYLILDSLIQKGVVTYFLRSGVKRYKAKNPQRLLFYLNEQKEALEVKERELKKVLPSLEILFNENNNETKGEIFEGIRGFKTFHEWMLGKLKRGDTLYVMGAPRGANEKYGAYLLDWNKRRVKKGIKLKILYNHNNKKYGKLRASMELTSVKYMSEKIETPSWVDIFQDYVITLNVHNDPICFLIKDKESSRSYRKYFDLLWKKAKK